MAEVVEIGEIIGNIDELNEGKEKLAAERNRELTEDEVYYVKRFVTGNRYSFIHMKFQSPVEETAPEDAAAENQ